MSDPSNSGGNGGLETGMPASFLEAQERQAAMMTRAGELMANAAKAIWESQTELFQAEAETGVRSLAPLRPGGDPAEAVACIYRSWRENSERVISHIRAVNDVTRQYSWQLMDLYTDSLRPSSRR